MTNEDRPIPGRQYRLTGPAPSIAAGNTWAESIVEEEVLSGEESLRLLERIEAAGRALGFDLEDDREARLARIAEVYPEAAAEARSAGRKEV